MGRAALDFFAAFGAGRFDDARQKTSAGFKWFGRVIQDAEWEGEKLAAYVKSSALAASHPREVPSAIIDTWLEDRAARLFDGVLEDGDIVILVDIRRHGETSTSGVVVGVDATRGNVVRRVFDPHELSVALSSIHA